MAPIRPALVALLAILAGCPAFGGPASPTPNQPADGTPVEGVSYPPGVGPTGVGDSAALARAHSATTNDTGYTLRSTRRIAGPNGTLRSLLSVRVRVSAERTYRAVVRTAGPDGPVLLGHPPARATFWSNGSVYVRAFTRDSETTYSRFVPPDGFTGTWRYWTTTAAFGGGAGHDYQTIRELFGDIRPRLVRSNESGGEYVFYLEGETAERSNFPKVGTGPVWNVSFDAAVTSTGFVREFTLRYDRRLDGETVSVRWDLQYTDVGSTTVERPPWLDRALDDPASSAQAGSPS